MKVKRICFFTVGFAFNRLVRIKFYEKIFPKDVEIFLFTTDKYEGIEKEKYQQKYDDDLKRTKVFYAHYNPLTLPFQLRKFCKENKIDRIMNLGGHLAGDLLLVSTLGLKTDYAMNILAALFNRYKTTGTLSESLWWLFNCVALFPIVKFSKKTMFTDSLDSTRAPYFFLGKKEKFFHLAAPLDTNLFKIKNKILARKKLKIPVNKKVVIFVGRISFTKGSNYLEQLIIENPDIYFFVIGRMVDESFLQDLNRKNCKNFKWIEKKSSEELVDYYNVSDFSFCVNREGGGIGLSTEEALACGVPVVVSKLFRLKKSPALYQVNLNYDEIRKAVNNFFSLPEKEKNKISGFARKYAVENYSFDVLKEKYIHAYLD